MRVFTFFLPCRQLRSDGIKLLLELKKKKKKKEKKEKEREKKEKDFSLFFLFRHCLK
jgi:hypothetical protein